MKTLILATDFSELARNAYRCAALIAKAHDCPVELVHEAELPPPLYFEYVDSSSLLDRYYEELDAKLAEEVRHEAFEGVRVTCRLLHRGTECQTLIDLVKSEPVGLIVMATHGRSGVAHSLLGSFTEHVARHVPVPVLAYKDKQPTPTCELRRVLVPIDLSENAKAIFPVVKELISPFDGELCLLHVMPEVPVRGDWGDVQERLRVSSEAERAIDGPAEVAVPKRVGRHGSKRRDSLWRRSSRDPQGSPTSVV